MHFKLTFNILIFILCASLTGCTILYPKKPTSTQSKNREQKKNGAITNADRKELQMLLTEVMGRSLYEKKRKVSQKKALLRLKQAVPKGTMRVYATSFGNPGNKGESNYFKDGSKVRWGIVAAALPDNSAVGKWIEVRTVHKKGAKGKWVRMKVKDLGPWFRDDPYWKKRSKTPRAVTYYRKRKRRFDKRIVVNPAGLDITPWGWQKMGVSAKRSYNHSQHVEWRFVRS